MLAGNIILICVVEEQTGNMHRLCISRKTRGRNYANAAGGGIDIIGVGRHNIKDAGAGWSSIKETKRSDISYALNDGSNSLVTAAYAIATAVVAVIIAAADKLMTPAK
jgi:hypothetical protein